MVADLHHWQARPRPGGVVMEGVHVVLEPLDFSTHGAELFNVLCGPGDDDLWRWMLMGPFEDLAAFEADIVTRVNRPDVAPYVVRLKNDKTVQGMFCFMRIREQEGSAEIGMVTFSKALQRTRAATETFYLSAKHLFDDLGYRRYEWKCNSRNQASRRSGERFGFVYEGTFRQDMVAKGENRDTDWLSILDSEWPACRHGLETWLAAENFDAEGQQRRRLEECRHG